MPGPKRMDPADLHLISPRPKCHKRFAIQPIGRIPLYCSGACKQTAAKQVARAKRKKPSPADPQMLADERVRGLMWELLRDAGIVAADAALPQRRKPGPD